LLKIMEYKEPRPRGSVVVRVSEKPGEYLNGNMSNGGLLTVAWFKQLIKLGMKGEKY
jgi:sugar (pentulose or hexulose) kinase